MYKHPILWATWSWLSVSSTACRQCVQQLVLADNKATIYWPFVRGIHQWMVDSPHKGPVMSKGFCCHDDIMLKWIVSNWGIFMVTTNNQTMINIFLIYNNIKSNTSVHKQIQVWFIIKLPIYIYHINVKILKLVDHVICYLPNTTQIHKINYRKISNISRTLLGN